MTAATHSLHFSPNTISIAISLGDRLPYRLTLPYRPAGMDGHGSHAALLAGYIHTLDPGRWEIPFPFPRGHVPGSFVGWEVACVTARPFLIARFALRARLTNIYNLREPLP